MKRWKAAFSSEIDGYTLIETIVALALLVTVLVPLGGMLGLTVAGRRVEERIRALQLAERAMERTLARKAYQDATRWMEKRRWRIERAIDRQADVVEIRVSVYRKDRTVPLVELRTARHFCEPPVGSRSWR